MLLENHAEVFECIMWRKEETFEFIVDGQERFMSVTPKEIRSNKEIVGILLAMKDVTERELTDRRILEMARFDELSGLFNRSYFVEQTNAAIERAKRYCEHLTFIMLDIDNFKVINDEYGQLRRRGYSGGIRQAEIIFPGN